MSKKNQTSNHPSRWISLTAARTVISPPKHSEASWAESKDFTSASLNKYLPEVNVLLLNPTNYCSCLRNVNLNRYFHSDMFLRSPLVVLVGVRVDDVSDETVVMAAVCCARVHCDADEVVLVALRDLRLALFPKTCSTRQILLRLPLVT